MAIYKNKDIETNIQATHVSLGNIGAQFYTEDENSASIRIYIKHNDKPVNLATAGLTPILSLSMQDGSYFDNEPIDIVLAEQGLIQYKIRDNVIKHAGKVKATLRLKSETQSLHASEFSFNILSSGLDKQVAKEINIDLIGDKIEEVLLANASEFKGEKGDKLNFDDLTVEDKQELKGDKLTFDDLTPEEKNSLKGEKGDVMKFSDLTESEKKELKGEKGDTVLAPPKIYTRDEYNQLETKDSNTLYFISEV